jgi:hypothetical protein
MWYDCFNGYVRARTLGTAAQILKKGEPLLVFIGLSFDIYAIIFWLTSGKIQDCVMEEEFEGLKN